MHDKSRYSTTHKQLRAARREYQRTARADWRDRHRGTEDGSRSTLRVRELSVSRLDRLVVRVRERFGSGPRRRLGKC